MPITNNRLTGKEKPLSRDEQYIHERLKERPTTPDQLFEQIWQAYRHHAADRPTVKRMMEQYAMGMKVIFWDRKPAFECQPGCTVQYDEADNTYVVRYSPDDIGRIHGVKTKGE